jgi:hypothetical protein
MRSRNEGVRSRRRSRTLARFGRVRTTIGAFASVSSGTPGASDARSSPCLHGKRGCVGESRDTGERSGVRHIAPDRSGGASRLERLERQTLALHVVYTRNEGVRRLEPGFQAIHPSIQRRARSPAHASTTTVASSRLSSPVRGYRRPLAAITAPQSSPGQSTMMSSSSIVGASADCGCISA